MKRGERVLDVCCGTGDQATYLAGLGMDAYGIDLDPKMIAIAERKRKKYGKENLHFQLADATALPFEDAFFDSSTISLALHEKPFETQKKVISEMRRVTKNGGMIILADYPVPAGRLYRFAEMLVGGEHYACFKASQSLGGMDSLSESFKLQVVKKGRAINGGLELLEIKN
ncbi:Methyltransferase domain-containing protein [Dehalogenimonas formicexedens]|uniref:Methyltransferase domain-containing protein n=2 Tax=Dehalogenimonas formicexedens TaxID=1839801 RepID=A0A1P8F4L7_9CHLR|nr:Methyltransferase domain-containing protein [Dehalogenimonas formicexedens]